MAVSLVPERRREVRPALIRRGVVGVVAVLAGIAAAPTGADTKPPRASSYYGAVEPTPQQVVTTFVQRPGEVVVTLRNPNSTWEILNMPTLVIFTSTDMILGSVSPNSSKPELRCCVITLLPHGEATVLLPYAGQHKVVAIEFMPRRRPVWTRVPPRL